jgi:fumarate hydratase class II
MQSTYRIETDSLGEMRVPAGVYYGAQTARAVENFPISGLRFARGFIRALGLIKKQAAATNAELGRLDARRAEASQRAAQEVADGKLDDQFVVDIFQTGSGSSTNMNANEVIGNRAAELLGGRLGDRTVHPNDHVNLGQSSNDVIPTAIHLAALEGLELSRLPALEKLQGALATKAEAFKETIKIGRTHLQDTTPMTLLRLGLGELRLPGLQPDCSIMPGKVNPVLCEMVLQVGMQIFGNEAVVALAGASGSFELNTMMPGLACNLLQAIELLANASRVFASRCVRGLEADALRCQSNVERSPGEMCCSGQCPPRVFPNCACSRRRKSSMGRVEWPTDRISGETFRPAGLETDRLSFAVVIFFARPLGLPRCEVAQPRLAAPRRQKPRAEGSGTP